MWQLGVYLALSAGRGFTLQQFAKFNPEQIRVYLFEDFNLNPLEILQDIFTSGCQWNLCARYICEAERISDANQPAKPALTTQVRQQLIEVYREDIWRLQNLSSGIFKLGRARECYRSPAKVIMLVKP